MTPRTLAILALICVTAGCAGKKRVDKTSTAPASPSAAKSGGASAPKAETESPIEAISLLGQPLRRPPIPPDARAKAESELADALAATQLCATCCDEVIWYGRRLGYLHMYGAAVKVYQRGLSASGNCPRHKLHRHLGHRLITLRRLDEAIIQLTQAASLIEVAGVPDEVEPDGAPNPRNIPRSTSHTNIYYHLGLARYLTGDFAGAEVAYIKCLQFASNDDMRIATLHWLYMSLRRQGKHEEAASMMESVRGDMEIFENHAYHRLCLMYKGLLRPEDILNMADPDPIQLVSAGYGVANWYICEGRPDEARPILEKLAGDPNWPAFGVIAAEADLARGVVPAP